MRGRMTVLVSDIDICPCLQKCLNIPLISSPNGIKERRSPKVILHIQRTRSFDQHWQWIVAPFSLRRELRRMQRSISKDIRNAIKRRETLKRLFTASNISLHECRGIINASIVVQKRADKEK